ncbi:Arc family DNA-binding protein [Paenibacillus sp.]
MATDKRVFTLRLREKNFEKIKVIADKNKRSIAMQIEYLIEQHIEAFEKEQGVISPDTHNDV